MKVTSMRMILSAAGLLLAAGCAHDTVINAEPAGTAAPVRHPLVAAPMSAMTEPGEVAFTGDRENLYVHFDLSDSDIRNSAWRNGDTLFRKGDALEIFLWPAGVRPYLEIHVSPNNFATVYFFRAPGVRNLEGNKTVSLEGLKVESIVDGTLNEENDRDRRWRGIVTIPFAAIDKACGKADRAKPWKIQIARFNYSFSLDDLERSQLGKPLTPVPDFHHLPASRDLVLP